MKNCRVKPDVRIATFSQNAYWNKMESLLLPHVYKISVLEESMNFDISKFMQKESLLKVICKFIKGII